MLKHIALLALCAGYEVSAGSLSPRSSYEMHLAMRARRMFKRQQASPQAHVVRAVQESYSPMSQCPSTLGSSPLIDSYIGVPISGSDAYNQCDYASGQSCYYDDAGNLAQTPPMPQGRSCASTLATSYPSTMSSPMATSDMCWTACAPSDQDGRDLSTSGAGSYIYRSHSLFTIQCQYGDAATPCMYALDTGKGQSDNDASCPATAYQPSTTGYCLASTGFTDNSG